MPTITRAAELPSTAPVAHAKTPELKQPATSEAVQKTEETQPQEKALSPQFVALARKEKALRSQSQALKAREDALKAKETEYESNYIPKSKLTERFKSDPVGLMQEHGLSYDQLTHLILNQPSAQDQSLQKLQAELQELRDAQANAAKQSEELQKRNYEQAVNQIRNEAKLMIASDPSFETIKETGSEEAVVELIKETFDKDGIVMSTEDAAKEVEEYLVEEALKYAQLKKVQARLNPPTTGEALKQQINEKPQMKTITHAITASTKPSSDKDRRARAILAAQGKL